MDYFPSRDHFKEMTVMYIGLDLGSTYTKAAVFDRNRVLSSISEATPAPASQSIRYEIDGETYARQVLRILEKLRTPETEGILISTQMHGCILTDEYFHPLTPYISWRDGLGTKWLGTLRQKYGETAVTPSGVPWKGNLALCALLGRREEGDALPDTARFCTLGGYIIGRLTGRHVCHMTNAAPSGMADIPHGCWNEKLLEATGLDGMAFPVILTGMEACGTWHGIPVYPDWGDQQVCAAGAALVPDETLHISVGTAGLIGMLTSQWGDGAYENRPWITPGLYLRTVSGQPGGRHLTAFAENIRQMAETLTGTPVSLAQVLTYLAECEGSPSAESAALWQAAGENARIFVQNLYASFAGAYQSAAERFGIPVRSISFSGGCVAKNRALRHRITDTFRCPCMEGDHDVWDGMRSICSQIPAQSV